MAPPVKKPSKPIFKTTSPFTETKWPSISHEDQEIITELLYNLLSPLGEHRRSHITPSKGKRKREPRGAAKDAPPPAPPAIGSHILVGLNSVTRHLEAGAARTAPPMAPVSGSTADDNANTDSKAEQDVEKTPLQPTKPLSMVILTHPQPALSPSHAHIPTLLHLATVQSTPASKPAEQTRLITLPTSNDSRFASALHIPAQHVGLTECLWVDEALKPEWRVLNVKQG
ncbi:hypothetical protein EJ07DRAFT_167659 [Lizonia empirigonia]|nr:hypothetical protein EJ07DRAFT_167659 [Lizonia empirigonia]